MTMSIGSNDVQNYDRLELCQAALLQIAALFSRVMTVSYPDALLCGNQRYDREHLGMVSKCSFVSVNYANLEEP